MIHTDSIPAKRLFGSKPIRPMTIVTDAAGAQWLCNEDVDVRKDLRDQDCWNCDEVVFCHEPELL